MINTLAGGLVPLGVHVLHVAIEAAELGQELCLVHVSLSVLHVDLDARSFVEAPISVVLGVLDGLTEHEVVLDPLVGLVLHITLLLLAR